MHRAVHRGGGSGSGGGATATARHGGDATAACRCRGTTIAAAVAAAALALVAVALVVAATMGPPRRAPAAGGDGGPGLRRAAAGAGAAGAGPTPGDDAPPLPPATPGTAAPAVPAVPAEPVVAPSDFGPWFDAFVVAVAAVPRGEGGEAAARRLRDGVAAAAATLWRYESPFPALRGGDGGESSGGDVVVSGGHSPLSMFPGGVEGDAAAYGVDDAVTLLPKQLASQCYRRPLCRSCGVTCLAGSWTRVDHAIRRRWYACC